MKPTNMNNESNNKTNITWGPDTNTLDDWLENDLKQSSLFKRSNNSKCSLNNIIIQDNEPLKQENIEVKREEPDIKAVQQKLHNDNNNKSLPAHLIPLIKVYSLLNAIKQNEIIAKENKHNANNKILITSSAPPSPIMSISSSKTSNINSNKKRRGNYRVTVDSDVKRQKNTDAARRSRLKKVNQMGSLQVKVDKLQNNNERLRVKLAVLETDINYAAEKEQRNRQRVLDLEVQLAMAHKRLIEDYKNGE